MAEKRDFTKEIHKLINRQARKDKQKSEELAKAQRSRAIEDEVSKKGMNSEVDMKILKKKKWNDDWKTYLEEQGSTND